MLRQSRFAIRFFEKHRCLPTTQDSLAEWSKALAQGASPQGRGFEPHSCHSKCSGVSRSRLCEEAITQGAQSPLEPAMTRSLPTSPRQLRHRNEGSHHSRRTVTFGACKDSRPISPRQLRYRSEASRLRRWLGTRSQGKRGRARQEKPRAAPGIEPGTSRTRSENHTTRPSSRMTTAKSIMTWVNRRNATSAGVTKIPPPGLEPGSLG